MASKLFTREKNGATKSAVQAKSAPASGMVLNVDFPQEKEKILLGHYAIRLTARVGGPVELSINKGDWKLCRPGVGYHWFDWLPETAGAHKLEARVKTADGQFKKSAVRACTVLKPKKV